MQMQSESITKLAAALLKAQQNMGEAKKDSKNPFFKSSYADLNAVREATIPVLNSNGVTVLQPTVHIDGRNFVKTTLLHESGEWMASLTEVLSTKVGDPQQQGSGISYARRYGLQSFLNVGAVDDDGESAMGRGYSAPPKPAKEVESPKPAPAVKNTDKEDRELIEKLEKKVTKTPAVAATSGDGWD